MKIKLIIYVLILQCSSNCLSQDTKNFDKIVEEYYSKWNISYGNESASYALKFYNENGFPPRPHEIDKYKKSYYKKQRDKYIQKIKNSYLCMETAIDSIEKRLMIIEYGKNRLRQDTMISLLIDELYEISNEEAIRFSFERFSYFNILDRNRNRIDDPFNIKEYPYIYSMYYKMPISRFIELLLVSDLEESLIELCISQFRKDYSLEELDKLKMYTEIFISINKINKVNNFFLTKLKAI